MTDLEKSLVMGAGVREAEIVPFMYCGNTFGFPEGMNNYQMRVLIGLSADSHFLLDRVILCAPGLRSNQLKELDSLGRSGTISVIDLSRGRSIIPECPLSVGMPFRVSKARKGARYYRFLSAGLKFKIKPAWLLRGAATVAVDFRWNGCEVS